jgi:hypothetical protein
MTYCNAAHSVAVFSCCRDVVRLELVKCEHLIVSTNNTLQHGGFKLAPAWAPLGLNKGNDKKWNATLFPLDRICNDDTYSPKIVTERLHVRIQ